jgi:hypothetical protein
MAAKGKEVLLWVEKELPPLSWGVITIKAMRTFMAAKINPRAMDDSTVFDDDLIKEIGTIVKNTYNKTMPY